MDLPFVDSHCIEIHSPASVVWSELVTSLPMLSGRRGRVTFAQAVRCREVRASPGPMQEGSTVVGFRVARFLPGQLLLLEGQHRFSRYSLAFRLAKSDEATELCADTHAEFPGAPGKLYRAAAIGSRGHLILVRAMLKRVKR